MEAIYEVEVTTGSMIHAGTFDNILITLIGTQGVSERTKLDSYGRDFKTGMVSSFFFSFTLGNLLLIRLEKDHFMFLPENDWFCSLVNVRTPEKDLINFPCYRWMAEGEVIELQQAKGLYMYLLLLGEIKMQKLARKPDQWVQMEDMKSACWSSRTALHWMDDDFLRYQLLNGPNPMMIHRCTELPLNFAITDGTLKNKAASKGNIFLCDNKRLADLPTQVINGKQQHVASPLCLLYRNQVGKFLPIQNCIICDPGPPKPVLSVNFSKFSFIHHMRVMYFVCVLLSKLLVPHTRYTLQINTLIRNELLGPEGAVTQNTSIGDEGMTSLLKKALSDLTYSSLCLPEDISDRGLESVPNFFCRDGGHRLWMMVMCSQWDTELQDWIKEIFIHGFLEQSSTGESDDRLWLSYLDKNTLLDTLPDMNTSAYLVSVFWLLSKPSLDLVPLGQYPEDYFCQMSINDRNNGLQVPYTYMCPDNISNSVSI
uniref:PLAT domain-containing protein n=1 Tax=Sinocyclocheilus grahami TaxID=75366 RepID=A0A672Q3U0_SINGR